MNFLNYYHSMCNPYSVSFSKLIEAVTKFNKCNFFTVFWNRFFDNRPGTLLDLFGTIIQGLNILMLHLKMILSFWNWISLWFLMMKLFFLLAYHQVRILWTSILEVKTVGQVDGDFCMQTFLMILKVICTATKMLSLF